LRPSTPRGTKAPNGTRRAGAFGVFNRPLEETRQRLASLRRECAQAQIGRGPTTGRYPDLDRLRHLYADVLQLNVIFTPEKGWIPIREKDGSGHLSSCTTHKHYTCRCKYTRALAFRWANNPVWGHAPSGALTKSRRFCSLLNYIVEHGHTIDLTHDLMRIAITFWQSSMQNFNRLTRRIIARIAQSVRSFGSTVLKSPEPEPAASGGLGSNPAIQCRVNWYHTKFRSSRKKTYVPRYIPPFKRKAYSTLAGNSLKTLLGLMEFPS